MAQLPVRSLTIYKQGIGYFRHRGTIADSTLSLVVSRGSLKDVLKSLDIVVHAGGPLQSVDYETPADKARQLANLPVQLTNRAGLADLLTSLRGSAVTVQRGDGSSIDGRIVGVEASLANAEQPPTVVLQRELELLTIPLSELRGLTLRDERAAQDVAFFLDMSRTEQSRTTLTVRLASGEHDLELSYRVGRLRQAQPMGVGLPEPVEGNPIVLGSQFALHLLEWVRSQRIEHVSAAWTIRLPRLAVGSGAVAKRLT